MILFLRVLQIAPWKCSNMQNIKILWCSKSLLDHPQTPTICFSSPFKFSSFSSFSNSFFVWKFYSICWMKKSYAIVVMFCKVMRNFNEFAWKRQFNHNAIFELGAIKFVIVSFLSLLLKWKLFSFFGRWILALTIRSYI